MLFSRLPTYPILIFRGAQRQNIWNIILWNFTMVGNSVPDTPRPAYQHAWNRIWLNRQILLIIKPIRCICEIHLMYQATFAINFISNFVHLNKANYNNCTCSAPIMTLCIQYIILYKLLQLSEYKLIVLECILYIYICILYWCILHSNNETS